MGMLSAGPLADNKENIMQYRMPCLLVLALLATQTAQGQNSEQVARLDALQERLALLQGEAARVDAAHDISRLQSQYAYYLEQGMAAEIVDLFASTEDVEVEFGIRGIYRGRDSIQAFFERYHEDISSAGLYSHLTFQPLITVAPDARSAQARFRGLVLSGIGGEEDGWQEGPYENEYVLEDGEWKFQRIHWFTTLISSYDEGWHQAPQPMPAAYQDLPPDAPPTYDYQAFPEAFLVPYHYENPVTGERPETQPVAVIDQSTAALSDRLATLRERLDGVNATAARVEDINALETLQRKFGYYLDKMLWDDVVALFTEDAVLEMGPSGTYRGRERIREYFYSLNEEGTEGPLEGIMYNHFQLQPVISLDESAQSAQARWRTLMQLGTHVEGGDSGGQWGAGPYENRYEKVADEWKISSLHWYPTFIAPYDEGWSHASTELIEEYSLSPSVEPDEPASDRLDDNNDSRPPFHWHE